MKVKLTGTDEIVVAKRFRDMTKEEKEASTTHPELWEDDCIFVEPDDESEDKTWMYMFDHEVEIIEE